MEEYFVYIFLMSVIHCDYILKQRLVGVIIFILSSMEHKTFRRNYQQTVITVLKNLMLHVCDLPYKPCPKI